MLKVFESGFVRPKHFSTLMMISFQIHSIDLIARISQQFYNEKLSEHDKGVRPSSLESGL